jgi:hypothetical protein
MDKKEILALPATAKEIRDLVGELDDTLLLEIQAVGASRDEIGEAVGWMGSDDYLHRKLKHSAHGRVAQVIELLEHESPPPEPR